MHCDHWVFDPCKFDELRKTVLFDLPQQSKNQQSKLSLS